MQSTEQVEKLLTEGEAKAQAAELAGEHEVHGLIAHLKDLYERIYGAIALDIHDWHWIATSVKNKATGGTKTDEEVTHDAAISDAETGRGEAGIDPTLGTTHVGGTVADPVVEPAVAPATVEPVAPPPAVVSPLSTVGLATPVEPPKP